MQMKLKIILGEKSIGRQGEKQVPHGHAHCNSQPEQRELGQLRIPVTAFRVMFMKGIQEYEGGAGVESKEVGTHQELAKTESA